jgi:hypothetical protein
MIARDRLLAAVMLGAAVGAAGTPCREGRSVHSRRHEVPQ